MSRRFRLGGRAVCLEGEASKAVPAQVVRLAGEHSGQTRVGRAHRATAVGRGTRTQREEKQLHPRRDEERDPRSQKPRAHLDSRSWG